MQRYGNFGKFKSVYSIFVSRVDVYTEKHVPQLSPAAQGMVGIVGAKRIWAENQRVLARQETAAGSGDRLRQHRHQEARGPALEVRRRVRRQRHRDQSAGHERRGREERPDVHPRRRQAAAAERCSTRSTEKVDVEQLEATLMAEGIKKFADPQKALLALIAKKRKSLAGLGRTKPRFACPWATSAGHSPASLRARDPAARIRAWH